MDKSQTCLVKHAKLEKIKNERWGGICGMCWELSGCASGLIFILYLEVTHGGPLGN